MRMNENSSSRSSRLVWIDVRLACESEEGLNHRRCTIHQDEPVWLTNEDFEHSLEKRESHVRPICLILKTLSPKTLPIDASKF